MAKNKRNESGSDLRSLGLKIRFKKARKRIIIVAF